MSRNNPSSNYPVEQSIAHDLVHAALCRAVEAMEEQERDADIRGRLLAEINVYIDKLRSRKSDYLTLPALFVKNRTFFGGYYKETKLEAAEYLKNMVMHFMIHDEKTQSTATLILEDKTPQTIGQHLGPLTQGGLGHLFDRYLNCSCAHSDMSDPQGHYSRYQKLAMSETRAAPHHSLTN